MMKWFQLFPPRILNELWIHSKSQQTSPAVEALAVNLTLFEREFCNDAKMTRTLYNVLRHHHYSSLLGGLSWKYVADDGGS